jgi:hypothetical protein
MKSPHSPAAPDSEHLVHLPDFPIPGNQLFERLAAAVCAARGHPLPNKYLTALVGHGDTTVNYWLRTGSQKALVSWFCLLEQLSTEQRHALVDSLCRDLPTLQHPRINHDPVSVSQLTRLLRQPRGLTLLSGDEGRVFLLQALGHTFYRLDPTYRQPVGLGVHEPMWFVPLEKMSYLKDPLPMEELRARVRALWPQVRDVKAPLVLLDGIWSALPELHRPIICLSRQRHVIVADQQVVLSPALAMEAERPVHRVTVTKDFANTAQLRIEVRAH